MARTLTKGISRVQRLRQSRFQSLAQQIAKRQATLERAKRLPLAPPTFPSVKAFVDRALKLVLRGLAAESSIPIERQLRELDRRLKKLLAAVPGRFSAAQNAEIRRRFFGRLPEVTRLVGTDVAAAEKKDPASEIGPIEIILCYPGIWATAVYRLAHELHKLNVSLLPRFMTEYAHSRTGIDIHPGAVIGESFFIDHGTGVVIGGTARIGKHVTIYQGVTLGARRFEVDRDGNLVRGTKRHPTLQDHVTVYANASVLGGDTVIGFGAVIGASVTIVKSVPREMIVYRTGQQLNTDPDQWRRQSKKRRRKAS